MDAETYPTVRIPRTICPDMKAGQKLTLTIVDVGEDEYEVRYQGAGDRKQKTKARAVAQAIDQGMTEGGSDGSGSSGVQQY